MRRARRAAVVAALLVAALVAAGWAAEAWLASTVSQRVRRALEDAPGVEGTIADVDACLPCMSYTIRGVSVRSQDDGGAAESRRSRLLDAGAIEVGVLGASLLTGSPRGEIVLRDATLHVDVGKATVGEGGRTALDVPWKRVGATLIPLPVDRVGVRDGTLVVAHAGLGTPVTWRFDAIEGAARDLAGDGATPPRVRARGGTPGDGRFEGRVELAGDDAGGFTLTGELRDVPLAALRSYLRQVLGLDVEEGRLFASVHIDGTARGWHGTIDCMLRDLDVFEPADLVEGSPARALWDAVAGGVASAANVGGGGGPLEARLSVEHEIGGAELDTWSTLATLLRKAILAPFTRPLATLRAAALTPGGENEDGEDAGGADGEEEDD